MNGVMSKIKIPFPSVDEQRRISACLASLDDLIAAQTHKLDALKRHKHGLMQQLFPAPDAGEGVSKKVQAFATLDDLAAHLRAELQPKASLPERENRFILLYAYNGTGKTRLSLAFKNAGKHGDERDTLYFNAFTEDLFTWDNDLESDSERVLKMNASSRFFAGLQNLEMETHPALPAPLLRHRLSHRLRTVDYQLLSNDWRGEIR